MDTQQIEALAAIRVKNARDFLEAQFKEEMDWAKAQSRMHLFVAVVACTAVGVVVGYILRWVTHG